MGAPTGRVIYFLHRSKVSSVKDFASDSMFWASLKPIAHLLKVINMVKTVMEGRSVQISFALLSSTLIYKVLKKFLLPSDFINHVRASLRKRYRTIFGDMRELSPFLDPLSHMSGGMMSKLSLKEKKTSHSKAVQTSSKYAPGF